MSFTATRETKLQSLHYKIVHRIISCKKWLFNLKIVDSPYCDRCHDNVDDIIHYFCNCIYVANFWNDIENWWNENADYMVKICKKHILFGIYYDINEFAAINYIIILAKWYIHKQHQMERSITLHGFLRVLKDHLVIEKHICTTNNTLESFNKKWNIIMNTL